jgi:hypothetical protein
LPDVASIEQPLHITNLIRGSAMSSDRVAKNKKIAKYLYLEDNRYVSKRYDKETRKITTKTVGSINAEMSLVLAKHFEFQKQEFKNGFFAEWPKKLFTNVKKNAKTRGISG